MRGMNVKIVIIEVWLLGL